MGKTAALCLCNAMQLQHLTANMVCQQVAKHYNLSIVSPVPARCAKSDCFYDNPFTWCAACSHAKSEEFRCLQ